MKHKITKVISKKLWGICKSVLDHYAGSSFDVETKIQLTMAVMLEIFCATFNLSLHSGTGGKYHSRSAWNNTTSVSVMARNWLSLHPPSIKKTILNYFIRHLLIFSVYLKAQAFMNITPHFHSIGFFTAHAHNILTSVQLQKYLLSLTLHTHFSFL